MINVSFFEILVFVEVSDGFDDAFLHRNVLAKVGIDAAEPGAFVKVRIVQEDRGRHVVEVLSVDSSTAIPEAQRHRKVRSKVASALPGSEFATA